MTRAAGNRRGEQLVIDPRLARHLGDADPFDSCMSLQGEPIRQAPGRRTVRFTVDGQGYYAKIHSGVGWREIFKNLSQLRRPVLGADVERDAISRVTQLGIRTTPVVAHGCRGRNPAARESFLITSDIGPTISLEQLAEQASDHGIDLNLKRRIINQVARIVRTLHTNGINHRDLYLCHFEMDRHLDARSAPGKLCLMDLHRAQLRPRVPHRWLVKDLAALLFSSLDAPLTQRDLLRFVRMYRQAPLSASLKADARLWRQVWQRAMRLYRSHWNRTPSAPAYNAAGCDK